MKVKNINGTTDNTCKCITWLNHWKKFSGQQLPTYCPATACLKNPEVGAHVQKESYADSSWYIVPLCNQCNAKKGQSLDISDNVKVVSANVSQTCGR